jgi:hypothetical protein
MNPFDKTGLIVGGTLLFGSAACGPVETGGPDAAPDSGPSVDAGSEDSGSAFDGGTDDSGPLLDTGPLPPRDTGVSPRDTGVTPRDSGVSPRDTGVQERAPTNGQECDTRGAAYCMRGQARYWCTGTHWQRTDNYNCRQGSCRPSGPGTSYGTAVCAQPNEGTRCDRVNQAWCDENLEAQIVCMGSWSTMPGCGPCMLGDDGYLETRCATPGFVGLAQANRQRRPGQSLRRI